MREIKLGDIYNVVADEFEEFRQLLRRVSVSEHKILSPITEYLLKPTGKHIRPLLVLLTWRMFEDILSQSGESDSLGGGLDDSLQDSKRNAMSASVLIEMIHWSTLVHDDVIDEAYQRRGEWTPSALMRSKSSVLIGDYLFSKGLSYVSDQGNFFAVRQATRSIEDLVEGELCQMVHARKRDITLDEYYNVIDHKTGSLIQTSVICGAQAASAMPEDIEKMKTLGRLIGRAFQIQDDILDYGKENGDVNDISTGKVVLNDVREGKITLPLICALDQDKIAGQNKSRDIKKVLARAMDDDKALVKVRDFVFQTGGVALASDILNGMIAEAIDILDSYAGESVYKSALRDLCLYLGCRAY